MSTSTRRQMGIIVALLTAITVGAVLLVGTALAQGGQRNTPGNGWGRGMMGGHRSYGMHAAAPVADTTSYGGWNRGMMGPMLYGMQGTYAVTDTMAYGGTYCGWGHSMMGPMLYGMQGTYPVTDTTTYGGTYCGWGHSMMGPMLYGMQGTYAVTDTMAHGGPCSGWGRTMMENWHRGMGGWSYPNADVPLAPAVLSAVSSGINPVDGDLPENVEAALATADPARGQQVALSIGCIGCHTLNSEVPMVGPTWQNMAATAATRVPGASVETYLYQSIINPNAFIVPGFPAYVMPQIYDQALNDQDLTDLIAYLSTLGDP